MLQDMPLIISDSWMKRNLLLTHHLYHFSEPLLLFYQKELVTIINALKFLVVLVAQLNRD